MRTRTEKKAGRLIVIGQGAWGRALLSLWAPAFQEAMSLDSSSSPSDWDKALEKSSVVILACPFKALRQVTSRLKKARVSLVINASKGIDPDSLLPFSATLGPSIGCPILSLSGPTFAAEILQGKPAAAVLASKNKKLAMEWAHKLSRPTLRLYASQDPQGIEVCGALKNVLAIACGLSDGLGLGMNARAALLTRGLRELQVLTHFLGGRLDSVFGLAGVGDLWLTSTGDLSRNRQVGLILAQGLTAEEAQVKIGSTCEGLFTVLQVMKIARKHKLDLPITREIYAVCYKKKDPKKSLKDLMTRALKPEETIVPKGRRKGFASSRARS